jgi:hypothetical protein
VKRLVKVVAVATGVAALLAILKRRPAPPSASPTAPPYASATLPEPTGPEKAAPVDAPIVPEPDPWVEPTADGGCPDGYPVKAKLGSKIFHVPEGSLYERTVPDRCYATAEAAEADGLRASKR